MGVITTKAILLVLTFSMPDGGMSQMVGAMPSWDACIVAHTDITKKASDEFELEEAMDEDELDSLKPHAHLVAASCMKLQVPLNLPQA